MHYTYVCYLCMIVCMLLPIACVPDIVCDVCEKVKSHHAGYYGTQSGRNHQLMMYVPLLLQTFLFCYDFASTFPRITYKQRHCYCNKRITSTTPRGYSLILMLSLCSNRNTTIRQAMYSTNITILSVTPALSVSTEKLTKPVRMLAKKKNPSWLKSTAETKHTLWLKHLTCLSVSPWGGGDHGVGVCGDGRG